MCAPFYMEHIIVVLGGQDTYVVVSLWAFVSKISRVPTLPGQSWIF